MGEKIGTEVASGTINQDGTIYLIFQTSAPVPGASRNTSIEDTLQRVSEAQVPRGVAAIGPEQYRQMFERHQGTYRQMNLESPGVIVDIADPKENAG